MSFSVFKTILSECGVKLSSEEMVPHQLTKEHPMIRCELQKKVTDTEIQQKFRDGMKEYLEDEESLTISISKTTLRKASSSTERPQHSLVHLFLTIDFLQDIPMTILLEKLPYKILDRDITFVKDALHALSGINHIKNIDVLANSLLENLDVAEIDIKFEILKHLPMILLKTGDLIATRLLTLIQENELLSEPTFNCLKSFTYSQEVKTSVLVFIYNRLLASRRYNKIFPSVLEFLLNNYDDLIQILDKTRPTMDQVMSSDMSDVKLALHKILIIWTDPNRPLYGPILKSKSQDKPRAIDIYLLLILYASDKSKCKTIEALIKRNVKGMNFSIELWTNLLDKYFVKESIEYLHHTMFDISVALIEAHTPTNAIYGTVGMLIFKKLFSHPLCHEELPKMMITYVRNLMRKLKLKNVDIFLKMMLEMSNEQMFEQHCDHLLPFVYLHENFTPKHMKIIFEIVCENVIKNTNVVEHLMQDIVKLFKSHKETETKKGVLGAVMLAKYLAFKQDHSTSFESSETSQSRASTLTHLHREALSLLVFVKERCSSTAPLGLFYDELAMAIVVDANDEVLGNLHEDIQNYFETTYIGTNTDELEFRIPMKVQFDLNNPQETEEMIYVNIGDLLQKNCLIAQTQVMILPAAFRFLRRVTSFRSLGKLEDINALLGCGVMLPEIAEVDVMAQTDLPFVANSLFHCINWFRELVSAFVTQSDSELRLKVIQRLEHIILLEDKLDEIMAIIPEHKLPQCYFYDEPGNPDNPKSGFPGGSTAAKRARYDCTLNSTAASSSSRKKSMKSSKRRYYDFREMDSDVITLLKYEVTSDKITTTQANCLRSKQFQFIVRDSIGKLASIMGLRPMCETLHSVTPEGFLAGLDRLMPRIHKQFRLVARDLFSLIQNNDEEKAPVFFTSHATDLKVSFDLVINLYKMIFSWSGFQLSENQKILAGYLKYFHSAENSNTLTQQSQLTQTGSFNTSLLCSTTENEIKTRFIENMANYRVQCLVLSSAAALLELLLTLREHLSFQRKDADKVIVQTANVFLKRSWLTLSGTPEQGKDANDNLKLIITAYLDTATIRTVKGIVNKLSIEIKDFNTKKDCLQTFRAIDKSNVHILLKCLFNVLYTKLRSELPTLIPIEQLALWQLATTTLQSLIDIAKLLGGNNNLLQLAKTILLVINLFVKNGFTTIEKCLKKKPDDVQALFTTWEGITRFMHRLMCEAVISRMRAFLNMVPTVRAALETFVLKVKNVLVPFKDTCTFFEGVLVNKNLDGEHILSQTSSVSNLEEDEDDDENLFDDDTASMHLSSQSASEIFE